MDRWTSCQFCGKRMDYDSLAEHQRKCRQNSSKPAPPPEAVPAPAACGRCKRVTYLQPEGVCLACYLKGDASAGRSETMETRARELVEAYDKGEAGWAQLHSPEVERLRDALDTPHQAEAVKADPGAPPEAEVLEEIRGALKNLAVLDGLVNDHAQAMSRKDQDRFHGLLASVRGVVAKAGARAALPTGADTANTTKGSAA